MYIICLNTTCMWNHFSVFNCVMSFILKKFKIKKMSFKKIKRGKKRLRRKFKKKVSEIGEYDNQSN